MKYIFKIIYSIVVGGLALIAINLLTSIVGYRIPFNIVTSFIVGFLGIPGLVMLILLKSLLKV